MHSPFSEVAVALREIAAFERMRIEVMQLQGLTGHCEPPAHADLERWRRRLGQIYAGAEILEALAPHEAKARQLDPVLTVRKAAKRL